MKGICGLEIGCRECQDYQDNTECQDCYFFCHEDLPTLEDIQE